MKLSIEDLQKMYPESDRIEKWLADPRLSDMSEDEKVAEIQRREQNVQKFLEFLAIKECYTLD